MPNYHLALKAQARGLGFPGMDAPHGRRRASGQDAVAHPLRSFGGPHQRAGIPARGKGDASTKPPP